MIDFKAPPHDLDAEMGVVGSLLINPNAIYDIGDTVAEEDFHDPAIGKMFAHLKAMHEAGEKIDVTLFVNRLKSKGDFETIGGAAFIAKVGRSVANAAHALHYANIVATNATKRRLMAAGIDTYAKASAASSDPLEVAQALRVEVDAIENRNTSTVKSVAEAIDEAINKIVANHEKEQQPGVTIDLNEFDSDIGGLFPDELTVLAARPGKGKTSLALQVAFAVANRGENVLFASLEMSSTELVTRYLAGDAFVDHTRIRSGRIDERDIAKLREAGEQLKPASLTINDLSRQSVASIRANAHKMKSRSGLELVVVDYIGRVTPANAKQPRHEQIGNIAADLKGLARDVNAPVLALCQLRRETERNGKHSRPCLSDLRESGRIEEEADSVIFIHRDNGPEGEREAELIVAKNRNGSTKTFCLDWNPLRTQFSTPDRTWKPELTIHHATDEGGEF